MGCINTKESSSSSNNNRQSSLSNNSDRDVSNTSRNSTFSPRHKYLTESTAQGSRVLALYPTDRSYIPCIIKEINIDKQCCVVEFDRSPGKLMEVSFEFIKKIVNPRNGAWIWTPYYEDDQSSWYQARIKKIISSTESLVQFEEDEKLYLVENEKLLAITRFDVGDKAVAYINYSWILCEITEVCGCSYKVKVGELIQDLEENLVMDITYYEGDKIAYYNQDVGRWLAALIVDRFISGDYLVQYEEDAPGSLKVIDFSTNPSFLMPYQPFSQKDFGRKVLVWKVNKDVIQVRGEKKLSNGWVQAVLVDLEEIKNTVYYSVKLKDTNEIIKVENVFIKALDDNSAN